MSIVIRIECVAGLFGSVPSIHNGLYVVSFDPDAFDGRGYLVTAKDKSKARKFETYADAMIFYQQQSTVHPVRLSDGAPNRPLTAFTVTLTHGETQHES